MNDRCMYDYIRPLGFFSEAGLFREAKLRH